MMRRPTKYIGLWRGKRLQPEGELILFIGGGGVKLPPNFQKSELVLIMLILFVRHTKKKARSMLEFPGSPPRRRFTVNSLENLLLAIAVIAAAAVGIYALTSGSSPGEPQPDAVSRSLSATPAGQ